MRSSGRHIAIFLALATLGVGADAAEDVLDSLVEIGVIPVGPHPAYHALTPDGERLYVGSLTVDPVTNEVQAFADVVDTALNSVVDRIPLGEGFPFQIVITTDGSRAYVAISRASGNLVTNGPNRIAVIDLTTDMAEDPIEVDAALSAFGVIGGALSPDATRAYVTHRGGNVVLVADTDLTSPGVHQVIETIPMEGGSSTPVGIDTTPDGTRAYVANRATSDLAVIDTISNSFMTSIPLGIGPSVSTTSVSVAPDGSRTYVTYASDSRVAVVDTDLASGTSHAVLELIETGGSLGQVVVSPDGKLALASDFVVDGGVFVIDIDPTSTTFHSVLTRVSVGNTPFHIAFQSLPRAVAYVTNFDDGTISVLGFSNESITDFIGSMEPDQFSNPNHQKTLLNKMDVVARMIEQGDVCVAIDKLTHDILPKVDGSPAPADWVIDTPAQQRLRELIEACIAQLLVQANAGTGCP